MERFEILLRIGSPGPLSHRNINRAVSCWNKCFVHDVVSDSDAFYVPRWHREMKNLTSLDYSSDLHDSTNYIV